jgi:hypothetical protein
MTTYEVTVVNKELPEDFVAQATYQPGNPIDIWFPLYVGGAQIPANSFISYLQGAGYGGSNGAWEDFLRAFLDITTVSEYVRYALLWADSVLGKQILTSDRVKELLLLAFPSIDATSTTPVSFTNGTTLKFPTFLSIPEISDTKFLITYTFTVEAYRSPDGVYSVIA